MQKLAVYSRPASQGAVLFLVVSLGASACGSVSRSKVGGDAGTDTSGDAGTFAGADAGADAGPLGPGWVNVPIVELHHDEPYTDSNENLLFKFTASYTWGVFGLTLPRGTSEFGIDLHAEDGTLVASATRSWDCASGTSASPNETGFVALDGYRIPKGTVFYGAVHTGGKRYTVEWYQGGSFVPESHTPYCFCGGGTYGCDEGVQQPDGGPPLDWGCSPFPTGHVAHTYDLYLGDKYTLYHADSCGCPGVTSLQTLQFVLQASAAMPFSSSDQYASVAPSCSACGSDQASLASDPSKPDLGLIAIDTAGQSHVAVSMCYKGGGPGCPPLDTSAGLNGCGSACIDCFAAVRNATGAQCANGACNYAACNPGYGDCDGNPANGCETSAVNAWAVTGASVATFSCATKTCEYVSCSAGHQDCDGDRTNGCEYLGTSCPVVLASGQTNPSVIAVDSTSVYWIDPGRGTVMKVAVGGGMPVTLGSGQNNPGGIAVDSTSVYWTNVGAGTSTGTVMKVALGGGMPTTLASAQVGPNAHGIAVDSMSVYWNAGGSVMKVALGGGTPVTLASGGNYLSSIAVDSRSVYWTDYGAGMGSGTVMKVALGGGTPVTLASGQSNPAGIAVDPTSVYWTNAGAGSARDTVMKVALGGGTPVTVASGQNNPAGIAVDSTSAYWTNPGDGTAMKAAK